VDSGDDGRTSYEESLPFNDDLKMMGLVVASDSTNGEPMAVLRVERGD